MLPLPAQPAKLLWPTGDRDHLAPGLVAPVSVFQTLQSSNGWPEHNPGVV